MSNIYFDHQCSDEKRRSALYAGDIFVYSPFEATAKLCALAKTMINEAFAPHDPRTIEHHLSVEECARVLASLKPAFIHHPECKRLLPEIIEIRWRPPQRDIFRCAPSAFGLSDDIPDLWDCLRISSAPRYLVFRTDEPTQLVAADI